MKREMLGWLISATILAGCGSPTRSPKVASVGPHQGQILKLPNELGFVEVLVESKAGASRTITPEVVAYFLGLDNQSPLKPPPTDVVIQVYLVESKSLDNAAPG